MTLTTATTWIVNHQAELWPVEAYAWLALCTLVAAKTARWPRVSKVFHFLAASPAPHSVKELEADVAKAVES